MPANAARETEWLILKAMHPTSSTINLPGEVADLIGIPTERLAGMEKASRVISFLNRGEGCLRVIFNLASGDLYIKELGQQHVVGFSSVAPNLSFNLPDAVERHLGLTTHRLDRPGLTGTDESLAWLAPAEEVLAYRKALREGRKYSRIGAEAHAYVVRAISKEILPPLAEVEKARVKTPSATAALRNAAAPRVQVV